MVNSYNVLQSYVKAMKLPPEARDAKQRSPKWRAMFKRLFKDLSGDTASIVQNIRDNYDEVNNLAARVTTGEGITQEAFDAITQEKGLTLDQLLRTGIMTYRCLEMKRGPPGPSRNLDGFWTGFGRVSDGFRTGSRFKGGTQLLHHAQQHDANNSPDIGGLTSPFQANRTLSH
jgi:hypothetical protein